MSGPGGSRLALSPDPSDEFSPTLRYQLLITPAGERRYLFFSEELRQFYGVSPEEGLGDTGRIRAFRHPEDLQRLEQAAQRALKERASFHVDLRRRAPGGEERWSALFAVPRWLPDGSVLWDGLETDITRFKRREQAILESEHLFREAQRAAFIGSYKVDFRAGVWSASEVLEQLFGIGSEHPRDVRGWLELVHPDDRAAMEDYLQQRVLGQRERFDREYRIVRRSDGGLRWVLGLGELQCDAQGGVVAMIGTIQDITWRKERDQERSRLQAAVEQAADAVMITDALGVIEYVNPAFERVSGYRREEALGQNPRFLKSGLQDAAFYAGLWATLGAGRNWKGRLQNRRKDGSLFTEEATISPVRGSDGAIVNFVAVKQDITERLEREARYLEAQKLETVGRLAGGVAHDFNNMLGVILSLTELELLELDPALPLAESLRAIQNAALRSSGLTKQLMAFARRQAIAPKVLDLNATVAGMLAMLQRVIGEDISLQWRPGALQGRVKLDPVQVDQLLANLCVNARDAIVGVGQVLIETADVELDGPYCAAHGLPEPGAHVRLSVSDNGSGMPAAVLERIFEPFFTTKGPGKGTGLGLATVYGIVRQNRGAIEVQSSLGQGSRFDIYLPCQAGPADPVEAPREALGPSLSAAVLLVEDEPELLRACGSMLRRLGCTVVEAASPQQALDWEADHAGALDLLLTDLVMPGLSGGDLARALRARRPGLPVLYMSGYTANIISDHGVLEDGVNFLPKPFTLEQLRDKLVQALTAPLC